MFEPHPSFWIQHYRGHPELGLHEAVIHGDVSKARQLLETGTDINKVDNVPRLLDHYGTPLHVAIWCNQPRAFKLLINEGADLNILDEGGEGRPPDTPIGLAVRLGRDEMFAILWNAGAQRKKNSSWWCRSLIEIAAGEGHAEILTNLLLWDPSWTQEELILALTKACGFWFVDSVAILLDKCTFNKRELEISMHTVITGNPTYHGDWISPHERLLDLENDSLRQEGILRMLLDAWDHIASEDVIADERTQLLHRFLFITSSSPFRVGALRLLLQKGADPNAVQNGTPLHLAVGRHFWILRRCNEEGAEVLLKYGARVDIRNDKGETAIDIAEIHSDTKMVEKLLQRGRALQRTQEI